ncbi:MAG TPA: hypothetical protein VIU34_08705 [Steroidobacter sp.]
MTAYGDANDGGSDQRSPSSFWKTGTDIYCKHQSRCANWQHIGVVGCSPEALPCYNTICLEAAQHLGPHAHPEVRIHTHSLADYVACLERSDLSGVGDLMLSSAVKLQAAGADFLICLDYTIHQAMAYVTRRLPLPWLHIAKVVAAKSGHSDTPWTLGSNRCEA